MYSDAMNNGHTPLTPMSPDVNTAPGIELHIKFIPSTGQFLVSFPQVDHVTIMGLLEFAKLNLIEMRSKADKRIAIPDMQLVKAVS